MPDFDSTTLWRISTFERLRQAMNEGDLAGMERQTLLSSTMQAELSVLERRKDDADVLEVFAACLRLQETALVYLQFEELVWPVTLFPAERLYHSPRSLLEGAERGMGTLKVIGIEPPGVRPPGHRMNERVAQAASYHPLLPVLWRLALQGPRGRLLSEIGGTAAYRVLRSPASDDLVAPGALGPAVDRLRKEAAPLQQIGRWPGMSVERGARLLNALYLAANLMVTRTHPSARPEPDQRAPGRR